MTNLNAIAKFVERNKDRFNLEIDKDWSYRECKLHILQKYLDKSIYDNLQPWHQEYEGGTTSGKYKPLSQRRPCVIYGLPEIIVNDSVSMLFGDEHFPTVRSENSDEVIDFINDLNDNYEIEQVMLEAAYIGSIGSVCIVIKVLNTNLYFDVLNTAHLTPVFEWDNPTVLDTLFERKKYDGFSLFSHGYDIKKEELKEHFWLVREWNKEQEIYYLPIQCSKIGTTQNTKTLVEMKNEMQVDEKRTTTHNLGFVPALWGKNISKCSDIDGMCTFEAIVDNCVEIDYQLSQLGRLLKYNSDPTLVIKNPSELSDSQLIKGIGALNLDAEGDAYLLEMSNSATTAVIDYVRCLREFSLEVVRGNRANPDKISALHSGKALQMLNMAIIGLVGEMRICYGNNLLIDLYRMCANIYHLAFYKIGALPPSIEKFDDIKLDWPEWYPPTPQDDMQEAQTNQSYVSTEIISKETALKSIADKYHITEIDQELASIKKESDEAIDKLARKSQNVKSQSINQ
jgi:hypothetical protein